MTLPAINPGAVVLGYSGERDGEHALAWAAEQAAAEHRVLALVHALEPLSGFVETSLIAVAVVQDLTRAMENQGHELLEAGAQVVADRFPEVKVETHLVPGTPVHVLREVSEDASCLVVGSRGRGRFTSALLGSVSVGVANRSACPVVVVRSPRPGQAGSGVLVGTDCSRNTRATLEYAYREASLRRLPLTVLYSVPGLRPGVVVDASDATEPEFGARRRELAEAIAGLGEEFPDVAARSCLGSGQPDKLLVAQSKSMDLVVIGHHRRAGLVDSVALGSYAPMVVERAACPVAVVFDPADIVEGSGR